MNAIDPSLALPPFKLGSEEHKRAFCRMLLDTFDPYKPAVIEWPDMTPEELHRVTSLPIWKIAVETEERASAHFEEMAAVTADPLLREALELIAFEENRHRQVLSALVRRYDINL